jgi:hypothetical protein
MTRINFQAVLAAPLIMATLMFVPKFFSTFRTPLLVAATLFLIVICFIFFWGCVWISAGISHLTGVTGSNAALVINVVVQLSLTLAVSSYTGLAFHSLGWRPVLRDGFEQTAAFVVAYLVYRALRRASATANPQLVSSQSSDRL